MSAAPMIYGVETSRGFATFTDAERADAYARLATPRERTRVHGRRFVALAEPEYRAGMPRPGWREVSYFVGERGRVSGAALAGQVFDTRGAYLAPDAFTREVSR